MLRATTVLTTLTALAAGLAVTATAAPASAGGSYLVGASVAAPDLGQLPVQRIFMDRLRSAPSHKAVVSFRDWNDADVHNFVRHAVPGTAIGFMHEPEQEITSHKISAQTWADHTVALTQIIQQEGRVGQVLPATILMRWTLDSHSHRGQMLDTLLSPRVLGALRSTHGVLGWDCYAGPKSGRDPQDMYGVAAAFSASVGMPWAVMETGATGADAKRWQDTFNYLDHMPNPPRYFLAWNPADKNHGAYAIQNQPAVAAVWRNAIRTHSG